MTKKEYKPMKPLDYDFVLNSKGRKFNPLKQTDKSYDWSWLF